MVPLSACSDKSVENYYHPTAVSLISTEHFWLISANCFCFKAQECTALVQSISSHQPGFQQQKVAVLSDNLLIYLVNTLEHLAAKGPDIFPDIYTHSWFTLTMGVTVLFNEV